MTRLPTDELQAIVGDCRRRATRTGNTRTCPARVTSRSAGYGAGDGTPRPCSTKTSSELRQHRRDLVRHRQRRAIDLDRLSVVARTTKLEEAPRDGQRPLAELNAALLHDGLRIRVEGSSKNRLAC